jgi:MFS family permease
MERQRAGIYVAEKLAHLASRKAARRLIPLLLLCWIFNFLDRNNIGFAALTMNKELGFTAEVYGFGAGVFFVGYFLFEVPSNLILDKVGARRWFARIMISWGMIAISFAFVQSISSTLQGFGFSFFDNARTFYLMRFIFGVAEAGFFPGIVLYLTYWFTADERARWVGIFQIGILLSSIISGPISGLILDKLNGYIGFSGWQWLFIIEGVPSVFLGLLVLNYLTDRPKDATWLGIDERNALQARLDDERKGRESIRKYSLGEVLTNSRVLGLIFVYFGNVAQTFGLIYWLPQITKGIATDIKLDEITGVSINTLTGYLIAVPYAFAIVTVVLWTRHSDATHERVWHAACPSIISGLALIASIHLGNPVLTAVAIIICVSGQAAFTPVFWTFPTAFLTGSAAAGGIGFINSVGGLGGFVGPYIVGWIKDATGETALGLSVLAIGPIMSGIVIFLMGHDSKMEMAGSRKTA